MSTEKKQASGENILKYWKYYGIVAVLISLGGWLYTQGGTNNDIENRIFSTKQLKYETEAYIINKPSPIQEQRAYILDSINKTSAIKSRATRDSIYLSEVISRNREIQLRRVTDSINRLNADQLYQIKLEFQEIKSELKKINN
jgi:antitoxin component HigA of HigAB toxin-antitoxin module